MLRKTLLYLSNQQKVFTFVRRNGLAKRMASRFVAGETIEEAMTAVRALNVKLVWPVRPPRTLLIRASTEGSFAGSSSRRWTAPASRLTLDGAIVIPQ